MTFILFFISTSFLDSYRRLKCAEMLESFIRMADIDAKVKVRFTGKAQTWSHDAEEFAINKILERSSTFKVNEPLSDQMPEDNETSGSIELHPSMSDSVKPSRISHVDIYSPHNLKGFTGDDATGDVLVPRLDLTHPENYTAWTICRTTLHNFGARVRFRLDVYNGNYQR